MRALTGLVAFLAAALLVTAQAENKTYRGIYAVGFEQSDFRADGASETWWLSAEFDLGKEIEAKAGVRPEFGRRFSLEVEAELSQPGHWGHMGAYPREIKVVRLISAKAMGENAPPKL